MTEHAAKSPIIEFKDVTKKFGEKTILEGLSFQVFEGDTFSFIGGSGTGKSVTLKLLLGLIPIDAGEIYFMGEPISKLEENEWNKIRIHMGMLFQGGALFDSLTVFENIAYPLSEAGEHSPEEVEERVLETLKRVGLPDAAKLMPSSLSGGMIKRVGLARAIITNPKVVLYDEPTAGLDPTNTNRIDELIMTLKEDLKITSLVVTHHMDSVFRISDRVALLYEKQTRFLGTADELRNSKDIIVQQFISGTIGS